jgi:hypothetical protein
MFLDYPENLADKDNFNVKYDLKEKSKWKKWSSGLGYKSGVSFKISLDYIDDLKAGSLRS